ncbi:MULTISPECIES: universal stress protein [Jonquetella]|uniref:Universal stress protein n=1 Tax=Jonquetella anthropi DSM 22815 TaxID=885272 RepID=H0UJP6_9BACT|nr:MULTISPECIES: universal stress protein [Jonquetella]EEX49172.1 universal stress family protein [Jonquetella anthropi E3_33 E1]EHM13944.1 universal stress protein UspA-like protein [Jonquetella anthropi DSM 22815]ERL24175.1 universal stress family protein [Jonquetella sp. BV3C21]
MTVRKILIAVDLSALASDVIRYGCRIATSLKAKVKVIHAVPNVATWKGYEPSLPASLEEEMTQTAKTKLQGYIDDAKAAEPDVTDCIEDVAVLAGNPTLMICTTASDEKFDMIVVGYRGHSALERLLVGSTASNVIRYASTSVLLYRPDETEEPAKS